MMNLKPDNIREINREAWNHAVETGDRWTQPVSSEAIAKARAGEWNIYLTTTKAVPRDWFGTASGNEVAGKDVLCLASGGGQQAPILAAAGAKVTSFDNSPRQLEQDRAVAERDGLDIRTIEGDMRDLSALDSASFDLIFHPVSNLFVPDVRPVWRECARVLRTGGRLLAGFNNPVVYIFDEEAAEEGNMVVSNPLPYSDSEHLSPARKAHYIAEKWAFEHSHTFDSQLAGQLEAGLAITGFYEDYWDSNEIDHPWNSYFPSFFATKSEKLAD